MNERWILIALHETSGIGRKTISRLMRQGVFSQDMLHYNSRDWENHGFSVEQSNKLKQQISTSWIDKRKAEIESQGIQVLTAIDENYPVLLLESPEPPWVLYCRGRTDLLHSSSIAMVGTRVPTAYGRKVGTEIAKDLCSGGLTVVSGMARGIDSVCHESALVSAGNTIAVLGTAMDTIYPPENRSLYERIKDNGLLISEYPPGTASHPGLFPQRNRIIAGLSLGVLVVEADLRSGSLITTDAALEAGRDVFAVPGPITSPKSRGALGLIKQGAKMVISASDIFEEYESWLPKVIENTYNSKVQKATDVQQTDLTTEEFELYHVLEQGPFTLDELLQHSQWDFGHLHSVLLSLIIKMRITQLPGAIYKII
ncbi:DNA-processing protein DprA [Paenibacillus pini]|nr:DNA-processing protein DprA [Paenibacillus pini]